MRHAQPWGQTGRLASALALVGLLAFPSLTHAQEEAPVNTGNVSFNLGADIVTEYWFRGIGQENQGLILQPYFDVNVGLITEGEMTVDLYAGTWNSFHVDNAAGDDIWFESDFFVGLTFGLPANFSADVSYVNLYNPDGSQSFAEEIDVALAYDDSEFWDVDFMDFAGFQPYALVAFEFSGGSDAGTSEGIYLELGVEPSITLIDSEDYPISLAVPLTLGLSLDDYYEDTTGDSDTFGYFDAGAVLSMPLSFVPNGYGQWSVSAGVHLLVLGDTAENISQAFGTGDDDFNVYGTFGLAMSY